MKTLLTFALMSLTLQAYANRESGGRPQPTAVYIDFRSFGSGIHQQSFVQYKHLVAQAQMSGEIVDQTSEPYGREGERLVCVQLQNSQQSHEFIRALAPVVLSDTKTYGGQRTVVYSGLKCRNFEAATEQDLTRYLQVRRW